MQQRAIIGNRDCGSIRKEPIWNPCGPGHRPAKVAENVHALTFQKANERANAEAGALILEQDACELGSSAGQSVQATHPSKEANQKHVV